MQEHAYQDKHTNTQTQTQAHKHKHKHKHTNTQTPNTHKHTNTQTQTQAQMLNILGNVLSIHSAAHQSSALPPTVLTPAIIDSKLIS